MKLGEDKYITDIVSRGPLLIFHTFLQVKIFSKIALMQIRANLHHGEPTVEGHFKECDKALSR